jgi:hypothetical protein
VVDPDFLYAALDMTACAAFFKESRVRFVNANKPYGKSEGSSGRTAGKNGPPSLNLYLQLPESGRVLANLLKHKNCEPPGIQIIKGCKAVHQSFSRCEPA